MVVGAGQGPAWVWMGETRDPRPPSIPSIPGAGGRPAAHLPVEPAQVTLWVTEVASNPRDPPAVPGRAEAAPAETRAGNTPLPGPSPHPCPGLPLICLVGHHAGLVTVLCLGPPF